MSRLAKTRMERSTGKPLTCLFCRRAIKVGDRVIRTSAKKIIPQRVYHEACYRATLHG